MPFGQEIGHRKGQHIDEQYRHEGEQRRIPEGVDKGAVGEGLHIVAKAHPRPLAGQLELTEGQKRAFQKRIQKPDAKAAKVGSRNSHTIR